MRRISTKEIDAVKAELLRKQRGRCPLCNMLIKEKADACLDHCHGTGALRAVLCRNCNSIEGRIRNYANRAKRSSTIEKWVRRLLWYWEYHALNPSGMMHPKHKTADEKRQLRNKRARKKRLEKNTINKR